MESLETTTEVKSSKEALDKTVPQRKSAAPEHMTAQTKTPPSADSEGEGWHLCPEPEEDQSRITYCSTDMSDSGKLRQLEGKSLRQLQDQPCSHPHYNVLTSYPPQERQTVPFARQKTADHLLSALPLVSCGGPSPPRSSPSLPVSLQHCSQSGIEELSKEVCSKMEQKQQQRPGKYVCDYCGRACAKPSVLKKHIRSHTGERPYPCVPCGFAFKTKSNLYKHRKSHAHSVKAGTVPFSELGSYNVNMEDRGSLEGEGEFYSDAEQSSDTDEDDSSLLDTVSVEEPDSTTAVKVLNLIAQKQGVTLASTLSEDGSPRLLEINAAQAVSQVSHAIQSSAIKQRLALRLSEKRSSDTDTSLSLPSQGSKGSTDSGYFSRSESAEHQTGGPPNTNAKSYQEIMFGKCYKPNPKQQAITVVTCRTDLMSDRKTSERGVSRVFTQEKESMVESIRINTHSFTREDIKEAQLELSDSGQLVRSNSMPTSSVACQDMSQGLRGSHSFDERASPGGIRRLTRQAAFEHSAHDGPPDHYGNISDISNLGVDMDSFIIQQKQAMEYATRKRRKENCVAEEEDVGGQYHTDYDHSEEMRDYDSKQTSQGALTTTSSVKGHAQSVHTQDRTQRDRLEREMWEKREREERRSLGNVISVIQHTNSLTRSLSEQSDSYNYQRRDKSSSMDVVEQSETREMHKRTEIFAHQLSDSRLLDKSYQMTPKLVRQSNIPVPEIRVTVEPDSPEKEKAAEVKQVKAKEPDRHIEEFQWPQRSETLSQFPPEKLPPKKKRLRLADLEHSSGESSFESACTSLSRSPSQDSNLSYCSSFSFDREEKEREVIPKPASPAARQDEFGKALEFLAVPGSGYSLSVLNQRQQHEMRRTSSEQAPCHSQCRELPEVRSASFDYGSLSPTAKVRHAELSASYSEPRRGNLVRQESLNVNLEFAHPVLPLNILPQYLSSALSFSSTALHSQCLPMFSPQPSHSGLLVPVRIQTHVPSYGSITYTTVSQILDDPFESVNSTRTSLLTSHFANLATNLETSNILLGHPRGLLTSPVQVHVLDLPPAKLKTGIPLSLTSRTISTTNCGSSGGSNKRMLSPASSLDLFMEVKQQKRVKEEKMYGEIVEELGAVELGNYNVTEENKHSLKSEFQSDTNQGASLSGFPSKSSLSASSSLHSHNEPASGSFISPQQQGSGSPDSPMDNSPTEASLHPHALLSLKDFDESGMDSKAQMEVLVQLVKGQGILISDGENTKRISQFPSLRTMTAVSWCYLNYTKPNSTHSSSPLSSVYATWGISSQNPNPPNLNTSETLALLRSKQTTNTWGYTMAAMYQPGTGKLVSSSLLWRQKLGLLQSKPELNELEGSSYGRRVKDASCRVKAGKEDWKEREVSSKQTAVPTPTPTPTRIKIFEGGFKSNEDYVYVRGRGRGKYICEECGIRCKKPSMLKKHIRTHTDVRPYVCRVCNFAFKTKGNLTKHMKSKAHMKKCLELGVSVTVDDTETLESDDIQQDLKAGVLSSAKHQFSDADDSDGMDEEIDDIDEDDEDEDDYDGDSTPKILSRSTSPQPCGVASLSVTAAAVIQGVSSDVHGCPLSSFHPLPSCLSTYTLPSVDIHPHPTSTLSVIDVHPHPHPHPASTVRRTGPDRRTVLASSLDKEDCSLAMLSTDQGCLFFDPYPTCLLSPGWESPLREPPNSRLGYPSTRRDLSPRGRSSPRWDTSPLRPSSPNLTPIQHLFPACMERPLSPGGVDLAGRRQRVVLRAVSPRRGGSQHRDSGDKTRQQAKAELVQQGEAIEMDMDQRRSVPPCLPGSACSSCPRQNLFSHLPLHSQQQPGTLLPMVPIGGIQVLHSLPSCSSDRTHLSALSPQKTELHQDKEGSVCLAALGAEDSGARQQEREWGMERERLSPLQTPRDSEEENPPVSVLMVRNPKQEEVLQTCTKAIASLRITSEEHL